MQAAILRQHSIQALRNKNTGNNIGATCRRADRFHSKDFIRTPKSQSYVADCHIGGSRGLLTLLRSGLRTLFSKSAPSVAR